jgi:hypothetical protein
MSQTMDTSVAVLVTTNCEIPLDGAGSIVVGNPPFTTNNNSFFTNYNNLLPDSPTTAVFPRMMG